MSLMITDGLLLGDLIYVIKSMATHAGNDDLGVCTCVCVSVFVLCVYMYTGVSYSDCLHVDTLQS